MGREIIVISEDEEKYNIERIKGIPFYRPRMSSEVMMRLESEEHLFGKFDVGEYTDSKDINDIIQHQFLFYSDKLSEFVAPVASKMFLDFLLWQYDLSSEIFKSIKIIIDGSPRK